jgi:hypothetical protein
MKEWWAPKGSPAYQAVKNRRPAMTLPTDAQERKDTPVFSGVLKYFPKALAEVARVSKAGNDQHNPGTPLHWDRSKSGDELDALTRHLLEAGLIDSDGIRHSAKLAWRALANLEKELEALVDSPTGDIDPPITETDAEIQARVRRSITEAGGLRRPEDN